MADGSRRALVVAVAAWAIVAQQRGPGAAVEAGAFAQAGQTGQSGRRGAGVAETAELPRDPLLAEAERELDRAAASYEQAVARLRKIVEREQERWDAGTRARVADRLARLDEAVAHSRAVADWLGRKFGADTFFAGAHFRIVDPDPQVIERWGLFTLLEASALTERDVLGYARRSDGVRFLWSRREEAIGTIIGGQIKAGQPRLG